MNAVIDAAMEAVRRRIASPNWADDYRIRPAPVGVEFDVLATERSPEHWSAARRGVFETLRAVRPRQRVAVLSMGRNEAPNLAEWVAHYLAIGADHIFMYTNDNTDGTDALLRWFGEHAPVTPILTQVGAGVNVQLKNYEHALFLLPELRLYEWIVLVDADEFLVPGPQYNHHLPTMLAAAPADTDTILFPWRWRLWDRPFERRDGLLAERYPHARPHHLFKAVMRMRNVIEMRAVHFPALEANGVYRDTNFDVIPRENIWAKQSKSWAGGWIDHYWGKSFEEFLVKIERGDHFDPIHYRKIDQYFKSTESQTEENLLPVPEPVVTGIKQRLARFAQVEGYAELQAKIDALYAEYARRIRQDAALRAVYDEHLQRFAW
jgi:hypothetical protein